VHLFLYLGIFHTHIGFPIEDDYQHGQRKNALNAQAFPPGKILSSPPLSYENVKELKAPFLQSFRRFQQQLYFYMYGGIYRFPNYGPPFEREPSQKLDHETKKSMNPSDAILTSSAKTVQSSFLPFRKDTSMIGVGLWLMKRFRLLGSLNYSEQS